jgi:shikimate dehydrogenase
MPTDRVLAALCDTQAEPAAGWRAQESQQRTRSVLVGLIGAGIQGSRTPVMHEREGDCFGLSYVYKLIDTDRLKLDAGALPDLLASAERLGFAGLNITHPFKQAVVPLLDELSPEAARIGAVNTVVFDGGKRRGHNTDCFGFAESFRRAMPEARRDSVVLLGAGGAGAAVGDALLQLGTRQLDIFDVDGARARALAQDLQKHGKGSRVLAVTNVARVLPDADGLVNTTPVGMTKYPGTPIDASLVKPPQWVADIIYFPAETELLARARAAGCRTLSGAGMAVFQAVEAFRLFTGLTPDTERMRAHFDAT